MKFRTFMLAGLALLLPGAASAAKLDSKQTAEIEKLLKLVSNGDQVGLFRYGELATGGVFRFQVNGDEKYKYYFNAICDDDCTNIDIAVFDTDGSTIKIDDWDDNAPNVEVQSIFDSGTKARPRTLTIEIRMVACKAEACSWGARVGAFED